MSVNKIRVKKITDRLTDVFHPQQLVVTDDSHQHVGHAGAKDGRGHFTVKIASEIFHDKSRIECHRLIYEALDDLMKTDIHALKIQVVGE